MTIQSNLATRKLVIRLHVCCVAPLGAFQPESRQAMQYDTKFLQIPKKYKTGEYLRPTCISKISSCCHLI